MAQRHALPITALFIASSFAIAITAGFGLGTLLLLQARIGVGLPGADWPALVQVHGHAQLVGFAGLLVMGIAYRILPRFRGAADPSARGVLLAFGLVASSLLLRPAQVWADAPGRDAVLLASGILELAGMLLFARLALRTLSAGTNEHRADELFLAIGAGFGVIGAMWDLVALAPAIAGGPVLDVGADRAAVAALLLGFVGAHIIGVSLRVAPAFIGAAPAPERVVRIAAAAWLVGVTLTTLGGPVGPLVLLATSAVLVRAIGPFRRGVAVRELSASARVVRVAFRGAYAWLVIGLALLGAAAVAGAPPLATAGRHAIALGFLTQIVFGVGSRLIPALTGGKAFPLPAVRAAIVLINVATVLRAGLEIVDPSWALATVGLALAGPVALAALLVFAAAAARTVRSAFRPFA